MTESAWYCDGPTLVEDRGDDIVLYYWTGAAFDVVGRLEQMTDTSWWSRLGSVHFYFGAKRSIVLEARAVDGETLTPTPCPYLQETNDLRHSCARCYGLGITLDGFFAQLGRDRAGRQHAVSDGAEPTGPAS